MDNDFLPHDSHSLPSLETSGQIANLASWVTGTEGSNPSLSAKSFSHKHNMNVA
jgi:hypothetical protein